MATSGASLAISTRQAYAGTSATDAAFGTLTIYGVQSAYTDTWTRGARAAVSNYTITGSEFKAIQTLAEREQELADKLRKVACEQMKLAEEIDIKKVREVLEALDKIACVAFFLLPIGGLIAQIVKGAVGEAAVAALEIILDIALSGGELPGAGGLSDNLQGQASGSAVDKWVEPLAAKGLKKMQLSVKGKVLSLTFGKAAATQAVSFVFGSAISHLFGNRNPFESLYYMYNSAPPPMTVVTLPLGIVPPYQPVKANDQYAKYMSFIKLGPEYERLRAELAEAFAFRLSIDPLAAADALKQKAAWASIAAKSMPKLAPKLTADFAEPGAVITIANYFDLPEFLWLYPEKGAPVRAEITNVTSIGLMFKVPALAPDGSYSVAVSAMMMEPKTLNCGKLYIIKGGFRRY